MLLSRVSRKHDTKPDKKRTDQNVDFMAQLFALKVLSKRVEQLEGGGEDLHCVFLSAATVTHLIQVGNSYCHVLGCVCVSPAQCHPRLCQAFHGADSLP